MQSMAEKMSSLFFLADMKKYFPSFPTCCDTGNWHPQGEKQTPADSLLLLPCCLVCMRGKH